MRNKNTLFIGKVVLAYDELPSTNGYAQTLLAKSDPSEGTVISAQHQTAGRGQIGSKWYSEAGKSICASIILYPRFLQARQQYLLNLSIALALRDALAEYCAEEEVSVKWPNDIYVGQQKLAGILIQNSLQGQHLASSIVGVGINVNQLSFPPSVQQASSLQQITGKPFSPTDVLSTLLKTVEQRYLQLKAGTPAEQLRQAYYQWMLGYGEKRRFRREDQSVFQAVIKGIDETGKLRLEQDGQETSYGLKEVRFIF